jgi:phosphate-selective porin OprO and OprP
MKKGLLLAAILTLLIGVSAQTSKVKFSKGFYYLAKDSSISTKFQMRFQSLYEAKMNNGDGTEAYMDNFSDKMLVRRARFKFKGHVHSPKIQYKTEFGLTNRDIGAKGNDGDVHFNGAANIILDAVLKYNFYKKWSVWVGQTKLPGNRERVISSANLQFVDRSLLNSYFNLDRDKGIHLRHHFNLGNHLFRHIWVASMGEGRDVTSSDNGGHSYTVRGEWLPFGAFTKKGDYFASDLKREQTPKLSLAANYNLNQDARRERGQLKSFVDENLQGDITNIQADMMFKYQGFSMMGEVAQRTANENNPQYATANPYYTGSSLNIQFGYLLKNNWEPAFRYTTVNPDAVNMDDDATFSQITFGISRYVVGHNLKVQSDISLMTNELNAEQQIMFRLQAEMQF